MLTSVVLTKGNSSIVNIRVVITNKFYFNLLRVRLTGADYRMFNVRAELFRINFVTIFYLNL